MICVSIGRGRHRMMIAEHQHLARKGIQLVELRLDYIRRAVSMKRLLAERPCPAIASCRRVSDGGRWSATEAERIITLRTAVVEAVDYIEIEEDIAESIARFGKTKRIISYHNLQETPDNLEDIYKRMETLDPDIIKISTMAHSPADNSRVLELCRKSKIPTVAFCMGEVGIPSRVLCGKFGAPFTYASFHSERLMAPGQITLAELQGVYRYNEIKGTTEIYGVIGDPVTNDIRPLMHNAAFQQKKRDAIFLPFRVSREDVPAFIKDCQSYNLGGLCVTDPHKGTIIRNVHILEKDAVSIQLCDTLALKNNQVTGFNVDRKTVIQKLIESEEGDHKTHQFDGQTALILGHSDEVRSIAFGFQDRGGSVVLSSQSHGKATVIAEDLMCNLVHWNNRHDVSPDFLINCTNIGKHPNVNDTPFERYGMQDSMVVVESIYDPEQTLFLKSARAVGARTISGVDIMVRKAVLQHQHFTNDTPDSDLMRHEIKRATSASRVGY